MSKERIMDFFDKINIGQRDHPFQKMSGVYTDNTLAVCWETASIADFSAWATENPEMYHITNGNKSIVISQEDAKIINDLEK